jgi:hypothetical protein
LAFVLSLESIFQSATANVARSVLKNLSGVAKFALFLLLVLPTFVQAQELPTVSHEDSVKLSHVVRPDTMLVNRTTPTGEIFRRPIADRNGSGLSVGTEAIRYYGAPMTYPLLTEAIGGPYPLVTSDGGYEREAFTLTNRTSEPLISTLINGVLPIDDPLTGASMLNYFPLEAFSSADLESGSTGLAQTSADPAASDALNFNLERFRAPVPYSRFHYTQVLSQELSNFEGTFSINPSRDMNVAFGVNRRSGGNPPNPADPTFNPRVDLWSTRALLTYNSFLGKIHRDSTTTEHQVDSILNLPSSKKNSVDVLVWGIWTSAFSGLSGGINPQDSGTDIFNAQLAPVYDQSTIDHRARVDGLVQIEWPFLADDRTRLSLYGTESQRQIQSPDSTFSPYILQFTKAVRYGIVLEQPIGVTIGHFLTQAKIKGEIQTSQRTAMTIFDPGMRDTRLAATFSDSLAFRDNYGIALFGFARGVQDNLTVGSGSISPAFYPSIGFESSIALTQALGFTASYTYERDRAILSPTPNTPYQIRNIGGFFDLRIPLSSNDSIALHAGVLDRHEPEGIILEFLDSLPLARFSNADMHTQSAQVSLDMYFNHMHSATTVTYYPTTIPITPYSQNALLASDLKERVFGSTGLYYEREIAEGNLRLSLGGRLRFIDRLDPALTYDPAFDYFVYRGVTAQQGKPLVDPRISSPKGIFDVIIAMEIDRRAHLNMEFLNILSSPYYNVAVYPRPQFLWKLDVTWAFLD